MAAPRPLVGRGAMLWSAWGLVLLLWTAALLTMLPVQLKEELFSPDLGFSAGKALHIGVYAALAGSALLLPGVAGWRWLPIASLSLHALLTEYLQTFVQRSGCWEDVLIDHVGIVAGVAAAAGLLVWRSAPEAAER